MKSVGDVSVEIRINPPPGRMRELLGLGSDFEPRRRAGFFASMLEILISEKFICISIEF